MRTSLRTISAPDTFARQATGVISLGQARSGPRTTNEYVDSPRAQTLPPPKTHPSSPGIAQRVIPHCQGGGAIDGSSRPALTVSAPALCLQPLAKSPPLKKENVHSLDRGRDADENSSSHGTVTVASNHEDGIICGECGRCRCCACTEPRSLPSHWCCRKTCEVSLDKAVDVCTCFCCIKCLFYHCGAEEDNECYEKPCGCCSTPRCCQRWTVMTVVALCLPCLWAYWPAKACLSGCTACYNHCKHKGCQCQTDKRTSTPSAVRVVGGTGLGLRPSSRHSQTRRLLIESDSSSA